MKLSALGLSIAALLLSGSVASADIYMTANFSGSINPGNNVKAPFFGNGFGVGFMAYRRRNKLQHVA